MRITFADAFDRSERALARVADAMAQAERQLSTARRINVPSDDALGSAAAVGEPATVARLDAYTGATDAASTRLNIADSVLSDIVNQLAAAQTTAMGARGSTQTQPQRDAAATQLLAIRDALMSDIN